MKIEIHEYYLAWLNESDKCHREDGPAIERSNGTKEWYVNGELHREDGPAVECADVSKEWCIYGECLTEDEFSRWKNED